MSTAGKTILMVDDDQDIRELLQTYLSRSGLQVHAEPDGQGFRRALDAGNYDLVILDV
ncbi:response regulator, partial [Pseudomonas sp. NBRC 111142]